MSQIKLSSEVEKAVGQYASKKGISVAEAANNLIATGIKRLKAVHKYMAAHPGEEKPKAKAKAKAPKAAKEKAPKAKAKKVKAEAAAAQA